MTSPASSSIVVVDKSGSIDASNLIQSTQHVHQSQHQPIRAQQVIVSDEYLSNLNLASPLNIANIAIPSNSHPNSKVHVISNVTLTKPDQSQPQTINFVNSKHIQTSSGAILNRGTVTAGNYVIGRDTTKLQQLCKFCGFCIFFLYAEIQFENNNIPFYALFGFVFCANFSKYLSKIVTIANQNGKHSIQNINNHTIGITSPFSGRSTITTNAAAGKILSFICLFT